MLLELFLGVIAVISLALIWWTVQLIKYKSIAHISGPAPLPIIGNCLLVRNLNELLATSLKLCNKYGSVCRIWLGCMPLLIVTDRELTELILRSPTYTKKVDMYRYIEPWLGNSILTSTGDTWQRQKKTISLSMSFKYMQHYLSIFNSSCDILAEILSAKANGHEYNIAPDISSFALDVIVECAMGAKLNTQKQSKNEYARAVHVMTEVFVKRNVSIWKRFDCLFVCSKDYRDQKEACKILHGFATRMIRERKKQLLESKEDDEDVDDNGRKVTQFLDILLNTTVNNEPLSEKEIRDDISSFIFAGHDTTAAVLQFLFYQLSNNQEVQNKIVDELKEIYGNDKNKPCTIEDTNKMKYMERVIKESMRYNAPVPIIARVLKEAVHYKNTILPKGLNLLLFIYGLHKNPDIYAHPDVFDPDRFISEDLIKPYSFLPFSGGPRLCRGQKFALIQLKVTVAKLLRDFEFLPADPENEVKLLMNVVLTSSNGINVRMKHRDF